MTKEEIIAVLAELHKITGFRVSLHGADYSEIAAFPASKRRFCRMVHEIPDEYRQCAQCDKTACKFALNNKDTHIYKCRYGFTEAVSPLYNFGTLTGFLMMGQVFEIDKSGNPTHKNHKDINALGKDFVDAAEEIPLVDSDMIR